jgi:hypothetical protein
VHADAEAPTRDELDVWQKFLYDILDFKAQELEDLEKRSRRVSYKALRLICAGSSGTGKSRTIRSIVKRRRWRAEQGGKSGDDLYNCCALAAPTGCASFHMKFGAATAHRIFGVPGRAFRRMSKVGDRFRKLQARLRRSRLILLDERSMIGRMFLGKIACRMEEFTEGERGVPCGASMGNRDFVMVGDDRQIAPVGDSSLHQEGAYDGKAIGAEDGPRPDEIVGKGLLLRDECKDVVILRQVHRLDKGEHIADPVERAEYCAQGDKYVRVMQRLADCEITEPEYAWLCSMCNRSSLLSTPEGRERYARVRRDGLLLMDTRKKNKAGQDGADQWNAAEIRTVAERLRKPIAAWGARHKWNEEGMKPEK